MEVVINEKLVKRGEMIGKFASLAGLLILAGGLVASFKEEYLYLTMAALVLGFLVSQIGSYNVMRWARHPRADEVLAKALKGVGKQFKLYNYFPPADHVLVGPTGVFVFLVKPQDGEIYCTGRRWRQKMTLARALLFFGQEALGNPPADLEMVIQKVRQLIAEKRPDLGDVAVRGAVLFGNPRARLILDEPAVPALRPDQVKPFVRQSANKQGYLTGEQRRAIIEIFDEIVRQKMPQSA